MASKDENNLNSPDAPEEDYSLEDILGEYGVSLEQRLLRSVESSDAPAEAVEALPQEEAPEPEQEPPAPAEPPKMEPTPWTQAEAKFHEEPEPRAPEAPEFPEPAPITLVWKSEFNVENAEKEEGP